MPAIVSGVLCITPKRFSLWDTILPTTGRLAGLRVPSSKSIGRQLKDRTSRGSTIECQQTIDRVVANGLERDDVLEVLSHSLSTCLRALDLRRSTHFRRKRQRLDGSTLDLQLAWLFATLVRT